MGTGIENKTDVYDQTSNRYGISGYLNEKDVVRHIFTGLTDKGFISFAAKKT